MKKYIFLSFLLSLYLGYGQNTTKMIWSEPLQEYPYRSYTSNQSVFVVNNGSYGFAEFYILDKKNLNILHKITFKDKIFSKLKKTGTSYYSHHASESNIYIFGRTYKGSKSEMFVIIYGIDGTLIQGPKTFCTLSYHYPSIIAYNNFQIFHVKSTLYNDNNTKIKPEEDYYFDQNFQLIDSRIVEKLPYRRDIVCGTQYAGKLKYELKKRYNDADKFDSHDGTFLLSITDMENTKPPKEMVLPIKYESTGTSLKFKIENEIMSFTAFYSKNQQRMIFPQREFLT